MLEMIDSFRPLIASYGASVTAPSMVQTLSVEELIKIVPQHDGWIIGDDPATSNVFEAGKAGLLKAAVKWGVGVDNIDFEACKRLNIPITNTPNMFGGEVADIAVGYVTALARQTFEIDRGVRFGHWPKPCGISLGGKTVGLIGYGDIGKNIARRLLAADMNIIAYDPLAADDSAMKQVQRAVWPDRICEADFIVINCALTPSSYHLLNLNTFAQCKQGVRVINVGRGPIIDELALENALASGQVFSAALDVYEVEPLPAQSVLRSHPRCILGSHNASNTSDAVLRVSRIAIEQLLAFLGAVKI
jgi:D-3-phosphoglycerate dehydrogenase